MSVCGFVIVGIERLVVLVGVEEMAELDDDLRQQLKDAEADIRNLKAKAGKSSDELFPSMLTLRRVTQTRLKPDVHVFIIWSNGERIGQGA